MGRLGTHFDPELFKSECAKLAIRAARAVARDVGRGPTSTEVVIQRLRAWMGDGKVKFEDIKDLPAVTDMLFDAWTLTSIREPMPGRPPIADWLHGIAEWEPPETYVAWRNEVETGRVPDAFAPRELLELYPLKPHELLRDTTKRILEELKELLKRAPNTSAWIVDEDGGVNVTSVESVAAKVKDRSLEGKTILLPPSAGGLTPEGTFSGADEHRDGIMYDVADEWLDETGRRRRVRIDVGSEGESPEQIEARRGMRLVVSIPYGDDQEGEDASGARTWRWYVEPTASDEQGSRTAPSAQTLTFHLASAAPQGEPPAKAPREGCRRGTATPARPAA